jgi:hypothetical protein
MALALREQYRTTVLAQAAVAAAPVLQVLAAQAALVRVPVVAVAGVLLSTAKTLALALLAALALPVSTLGKEQKCQTDTQSLRTVW